MAYGFKYGFNWGLVYDPNRAIPPIAPPTYPVYSQPDTGWAGDVVTVLTPNLYDKSRDDHFNSGSLDPSLWSPTITGKGQVVETTSLLLTAGPVANSVAAINSQQPFPASDSTIKFVVLPDRAGVPIASIDYVVMEAKAAPDTYVRVFRTYDITEGHLYRCEVILNGVPVPSRSIKSYSSSGDLRLIWAGSSLTVLVRDAGQSWKVLAYTRTWTVAFAAYFKIYTSNNMATSSVAACRIRSFVSTPGILFDTEPAVTTIPAKNDIQLVVPERRSYDKAKVPITVFNHTGILGIRANAFEYVRPGVRKLMDDTVRKITTSLKQDRIDIYGEVIGIYGPRIGIPDVTGTGNLGVGTPPVATAVKLVFLNQPGVGPFNAARLPQFTIMLADEGGQIVVSALDPVTISFGTAPSDSVLRGTLAKVPSAGLVVFNDLGIIGSEKGPYTLRVTSPNLLPDVTVEFMVYFDSRKPFINKVGMAPSYRHIIPF